MKTFSITEAEAKLPKLMKLVEAGEQILITREGEIVAELVVARPILPNNSGVRRRVSGRWKNIGSVPDSAFEPWSDADIGSTTEGKAD